MTYKLNAMLKPKLCKVENHKCSMRLLYVISDYFHENWNN